MQRRDQKVAKVTNAPTNFWQNFKEEGKKRKERIFIDKTRTKVVH